MEGDHDGRFALTDRAAGSTGTCRLAPAPLPQPLSQFIGRRIEIAELKRNLSANRLVTLTGAGGCGKTRLAIESARRANPDFADRIAFTDLSAVQDPSAVWDSTATGLGLPGATPSELAALVDDTRLLLVIDNAEHLIEPVSSMVQELLLKCPNLSVLVTSRELLDIPGEVSWRVPPLRLPPQTPHPAMDVAGLATYDAVQLFASRAADRQAEFRLTEQNAELVLSICRRLDGIPLALELAAARVHSLGLTDLSARLDDELSILTVGSRTNVPRQRTLRATFDWSHQLLEASEQLLFRRLAMFIGSFDLAAAQAVCSGPDLPVAHVADVLERLVDKSLLEANPAANGSLRYRVIEVIRQYGLERLHEAGEEGLRAGYAAHYAAVVERLNADLDDFRARAQRLNPDYGNVSHALDWAADHDAELELRMVEQLSRFWLLRGSVQEACERMLSALAKKHGSAVRRAALHLDAAQWLRKAGDLQGAIAHVDRAALLMDGGGGPPGPEGRKEVGLANGILRRRGAIKIELGDLGGADCDFSDAIALVDSLPASDDLAASLNCMALLRLLQGRPREGLEDIVRALGIVRQVSTASRPDLLANCVFGYGAVLLALDRPDEARDQFVSGLHSAAQDESHEAAAFFLQGLACVVAREGRAATCLELLAAAEGCQRLAGLGPDASPVTPTAEAEWESRTRLGPRAADQAWARGVLLNVRSVLDRMRAADQREADSSLPRRKLEIVRLVAAGRSNKEIGRQLAISERTVESHLDQLRGRFGFRNRAEMTAWAVSKGLAPT
jgi:predicted ATPase/DNA-binding CsgD family transcriptional regulator